VEIKAGQDTQVELDQLGRVKPIVRDSNDNEVSGYIKAQSNGKQLCLSMSSTEVSEPAPGRYDFRFRSPQLLYGWTREVEVKAGEETTFNITVGKD
jgi:hypothetical protein